MVPWAPLEAVLGHPAVLAARQQAAEAAARPAARAACPPHLEPPPPQLPEPQEHQHGAQELPVAVPVVGVLAAAWQALHAEAPQMRDQALAAAPRVLGAAVPEVQLQAVASACFFNTPQSFPHTVNACVTGSVCV